MKKSVVILSTILLALSLPAQASWEECSKAVDATMAQVEAGKGFTAIHNFYVNHRKCDDGAFAMSISGAVAQTLDKQWAKLGELRAMFKDQGFKKFFLGHIDAVVSASERELKSVVKKAKDNCPKVMDKICKEVGTKAESALKSGESWDKDGPG